MEVVQPEAVIAERQRMGDWSFKSLSKRADGCVSCVAGAFFSNMSGTNALGVCLSNFDLFVC